MADLAQDLPEKIRELSRRYEENPGRFFVPLANAYRDAGRLREAEELLRSGLQRHPGYLSAYIVLGRCLLDRGAVEEAANEFRYVLSVDPQNLIALRALGDMAAQAGKPTEASRWYEELLAVDPMNKEVRDALDVLRSAPAPENAEQAPAAPDAEFDASAEAPLDPGLAEIAPLPADSLERDGSELVEFGLVHLDAVGAPAEDDTRDAGLVLGGADGVEPLDLSAPPSYERPAEEGAEFPAWTPPEDSSDEQSRAGDYDAFSFDTAVPTTIDDGGAAEGGGWKPAGEHDAELGAQGSGFAEQEVVTETMAELYARQGFHERAIDVYRELIRQRGDEPNLVRRLAELEVLAGKTPLPEADVPPLEALPAPAEILGADRAAEMDLPVIETGLPGLNFTPDAPLSFETLEEPQPLARAADAAEPPSAGGTGDAFAASFANGFAGATDAAPQDDGGAGETEFATMSRDEIPAVHLDATETAPEVESGAGSTAEAPAAPEPAAEDEAVAAQPAYPPATIAGYLVGLLAWRGADAEAAVPPGANSAEEPSATTADLPLISGAEPSAEQMPWERQDAAPATGGEPMDIDDLGFADPAPAPQAPAAGEADEPLPWEIGSENAPLAPEPRAPEPPSGFSFEDFFAGGSGSEAPAAQPPQPPAADVAPPPPPAAPPSGADTSGAEDEEDLESFQAWLQSLKR